jgi:hypothetical protein
MKNLLKQYTYFKNQWIILVITFGAAVTLFACAEESIENPRSHFLLLDSRVVEKVENAQLTVGTVQKHDANPLFIEDKPWEKRFDNLYGNVIYDEQEKIYKCWYSPFIVDQSAKGMSLKTRDNKEYDPPDNREMGICYATSKDGITWEKPELGIVQYSQSKANNILWRGSGDSGEHWEGPHGSGIFKDLRAQDPDHLYKAIFKGEILSVAFSADGIHWGSPIESPEADVAGDTHNNAFWAPTLGKYVGITRSWGEKKGRQVVRIESEDFIKWTKAELVLEGISKNQQTYAMPVFYYGGVYLGLVAIHDQKADRVWTELTWSPDTKVWNRVDPGNPLIPCSDKVLEYDYGCVYPCAYPVFLEDEIRLYYGGSDYLHYGWRNGSLCLATLRPDGFAGYESESTDKPGIITTSPIPYSGSAIKISADVANGGWVKVSMLDSNGSMISEADMVTKNVTDGRLSFQEQIDPGKVRLQFELYKAKIYSFRVAN